MQNTGAIGHGCRRRRGGDRLDITRVEEDKSAMSVLETIVELGRTLNISITAEGVETPEQADMLTAMRCQLVQGYLFGRPTPLADVAAVMLRNMQATGCDRPALPGPEIHTRHASPPLPELAA